MFVLCLGSAIHLTTPKKSILLISSTPRLTKTDISISTFDIWKQFSKINVVLLCTSYSLYCVGDIFNILNYLTPLLGCSVSVLICFIPTHLYLSFSGAITMSFSPLLSLLFVKCHVHFFIHDVCTGCPINMCELTVLSCLYSLTNTNSQENQQNIKWKKGDEGIKF